MKLQRLSFNEDINPVWLLQTKKRVYIASSLFSLLLIVLNITKGYDYEI